MYSSVIVLAHAAHTLRKFGSDEISLCFAHTLAMACVVHEASSDAAFHNASQALQSFMHQCCITIAKALQTPCNRADVPRARRSNVQFDVEESPIVGEGSLKSTSWARKPTSNRSTFDVERSPDLKPSDHAGVAMDADVQYKEEQASQILLL